MVSRNYSGILITYCTAFFFSRSIFTPWEALTSSHCMRCTTGGFQVPSRIDSFGGSYGQ